MASKSLRIAEAVHKELVPFFGQGSRGEDPVGAGG